MLQRYIAHLRFIPAHFSVQYTLKDNDFSLKFREHIHVPGSTDVQG